MKKWYIVGALLLTLGLAGCGGRGTNDAAGQPDHFGTEENVPIQGPGEENVPTQGLDEENGKLGQESGEEGKMKTNMINIQVGDTILTAELSDNSSADALKELLAEGPLTVEMSDYGSFEKVGPIGTTLPRNDEQITTEPGDIILYQGNSITIYYDTNSWNFTRLGKITGMTGDELKKVLGDGSVEVIFSLP